VQLLEIFPKFYASDIALLAKVLGVILAPLVVIGLIVFLARKREG